MILLHILDIEPFFERNKEKITVGNATSIFMKVYEKVIGDDPKLFFDFLGRILLEKPELYKGKRRIDFFRKYNRFIVRKLLPNDLYEMERYFVEKYCLFEGEKLLSFFYGLVEYGKKVNYFRDRIFISNYRIFISDLIQQYNTFYPIIHSILVAQQKLLSIPTKERKAPFGYDFPLKDLSEITLNTMAERKRFRFSLGFLNENLPYGGKRKDKSLMCSVRFISQTHVGPCLLTIYVNHKMHKEGQKVLYRIRDNLQSLQ